MNNKAQFYLIAAAIIIAVVVGFGVVKNSSQSDVTDKRIYNLGSDLKAETGSVIDYGIYSKKDTDALVQNWIETYYNYSIGKGDNAEDWIFAYGNKEKVIALTFSSVDTGEISLITGGKKAGIKNSREIASKTDVIPENNKIHIELNSKLYDFELKE